MAQKTNPISLRLGLTKPWSSQWFFKKERRFFLEEDELIRQVIKDKILAAGIAGVDIERVGEVIKVTIRASRPGLIIGRGGKGIEELKSFLLRALKDLRRRNKRPQIFNLNFNVEELRRSEISAPVLAQQIAFDIEKRMPYRLLMKRHLEMLKQNRSIKGAKIKLAGRLNGAEIARREWLDFGKMPLQTLRANIDYGEAVAFTTYGTIGIKVWLYKGEIFANEKEKNQN